MNSSIYAIQNRKQYEQLVKVIAKVFKTGFEVLSFEDDSIGIPESNDFQIIIKFPKFDRVVLIGLVKSGKGYQTIDDGFFTACVQYNGAKDVWFGIPFKGLDDLLGDALKYDTVYAGGSSEDEEKQLDYFGKLKSELERLQKADDERSWWDKHSFGF
ncbi:hypothetical protein [Lactococcus allomyrinae]|uniref:Uncharacterized protein n=1 Tax=Lactococcus allomyrinae TaxID=2419773 RepID=A0A387B7T3_9LACT|nr:hypothetical protein [Lactococcus allomyrinae]AYF99854.1 hypothetical protein D7I46_01400 [Lactococcus allomyrinae]